MKKERKKHLRRLAERAEKRRSDGRTVKFEGVLKMAQGGFGFVTPESEKRESSVPAATQEDIFIPAKFVGDALDGDRVKGEILPPRPGHPDDNRGPVGRIIAVLSREKQEIVAELLAGNVARPLNPRLPDDIRICGPRKGAGRGDWIKLKLRQDEDGSWLGTVAGKIGKAGVLSGDLDAVMAQYDIPPRYSEADDAEALAVVPREIAREDCTSLFALTIDPFDAKDFDDAISLAPGQSAATLQLGVHIADVAAYIAPKSKFDRSAELRGFSCYLPGRTLPMLPPGLTARISMRAGELSVAHSVFFEIERSSGRILSTRRSHTTIRVDHRLNYDEVQEFIDTGTAPEQWSEQLKSGLKDLVELTRKLRQNRFEQEKFIDLPLPEIRVLCDENADRISGLSVKTSREAEQLVEECMLAANSAVGAELTGRGIAGIFRVHAEPSPDKLTEFSDLVHEAFGLIPGNLGNRDECNRFIASLPDDPRRPVVLSWLLRAMPRAEYAAKASLHFALGKTCYCHFTSPIRRYPDLLVHQQLWNYDTKVRTRSIATLERAAVRTSEQEENNDSAYYAATDRFKLRYLEEKLEAGGDNLYEAVITRVMNSGLQVDVGELGLYGFVPLEQLHGGFRRGGRSLRQEHGDIVYKPGNYIYLRLARIDFARGNAVFVPAGR